MKYTLKVDYWLKSSENDWNVVSHLVEKGDYPYALFICHLVLEKLLKALCAAASDQPILTHRLIYLAEKAMIDLTEDQTELLEIVTDFNLEARYPDEKFFFFKRCTWQFTLHQIQRIEEMRQWLLQKIQSSKT
jgi:HEPN domain-containing protein